MTTNVTMIVMLVAYICGAITKTFIDAVPNKYIPIQNVIIGFISAIICFCIKLEPDFINALIVCIMATMSAGGVSGLIKNFKNQGNAPDEG